MSSTVEIQITHCSFSLQQIPGPGQQGTNFCLRSRGPDASRRLTPARDSSRRDLSNPKDQLTHTYRHRSIFNVYNDCTHSRNENTLQRFLHAHSNSLLTTKNDHMLWAGDFNRHHPLWDRDEDTHLFTQQATRQAEGLIDLLAIYDLTMALPKEIPTLQHMVTKIYSRPDNVFNMAGLLELITRCKVDPSLRPTSTDHFRIVTNISIPQERANPLPAHNLREANWDAFRQRLRTNLTQVLNPPSIDNQGQLTIVMDQLTTAL